MKMILIYNDRGVSEESFHETLRMCESFNSQSTLNVRTVSAEILNHEPLWEKTADVLIIPGGRATPYYEDLHQKGYERIKNFVASGGYYLGICAGAYFAASRIVFEKGHPQHEIITDRSLGLYTGIAEGPAYGLALFKYHSEEGARTANIKTNLSLNFSAYFNGGCWFHSHAENNDTVILGQYADISQEPAAIITCTYGKGRVCLSGVHFEYLLQDTQQKFRDEFIQQLGLF